MPISPTSLASDDYCVLGLATCFLREDGDFHAVDIIEPIPSAALEAILKQVPTSYQWAIAVRAGEVFQGEEINKPDIFDQSAQFCDDFAERFTAAARTYQVRPQAKEHLSIGEKWDKFNFSLEKKRILNDSKVVKTEDNVKQHSHTHQRL
ncbi:hypothetical protein IQE94_01575 [Synechocystis sp. PCC 7339]|uniref:hypothetical protein n=1 Tax=Synechocystis sp. PCC 7339 TaxID=2782213 RepID=UPI001CBE45DB|nr:hypothetical protein [Synechocystis sp. PCC 7339]UAJ73068.1 hypothetical protein IQE94_01575 [Synechocystis sp. PCC 7339]